MKPLALFVSATPLPLSSLTSASSGARCTRRSLCVAKARGGGRGKKKERRAGNRSQRSTAAPASSKKNNNISNAAAPMAADGMIDTDEQEEDASKMDSIMAPETTAAAVPVPETLEGLSLPDLPKTTGSIRRRRRRRKGADGDADKEIYNKEGESEDNNNNNSNPEPLSTDAIERLTRSYRTGGKELVRQIEVEPDFMFRSGQAEGEYEFAAALIGTGRPNKQGVYVNPYLQTSHMILLGVILLGTFIEYPGFPLTEGSPQLRGYCKIGLALTFFVNSLLAIYAYSEAGIRKQPRAFWCFKTFFLGNIALQELKDNAPVQMKIKNNK